MTATCTFIGIVAFMPIYLSEFSKSEIFLIIMIQQLFTVPGYLLSPLLVKSKLGRKYSTILHFIFIGIFEVGLMLKINKISVILT